jgi:pyroglutamyl-peptidase
MSDRRVLVTGFGAFPGAAVNPTEALMAALESCEAEPGLHLEVRVLPVSWAETSRLLRAAIEECRPDSVLMFGLDRRARSVKIELRAANCAHKTAVDAEGRPCGRAALAEDGPAALPSRCDRSALAAAIAATGAPVRFSRNAGTYLCNAALWTALQAAGSETPVGLIHVPPTERLCAAALLAVARAAIGALSFTPGRRRRHI